MCHHPNEAKDYETFDHLLSPPEDIPAEDIEEALNDALGG